MRVVLVLAVGEPFCPTAMRISNVVEVGQVESLPESVLATGRPCSSVTVLLRGPGKSKRKISATPAPVAAPKLLFEFDGESIVLPKGRKV